MFEEKFEIIAVEDNQACIQPLRQATCQRCQLNASCGVGLFANYFNQPIKITLSDHKKTGDVVTLSMSEGTVLKYAFLFYILPLLMMAAAALMSQHFFGLSQPLIIVSAMVSMALTLWLLKRHYRH